MVTVIWWDWRSWLARQVVALKAVGSNPISHPMKKPLRKKWFFQLYSLRRVICTSCVIFASQVI